VHILNQNLFRILFNFSNQEDLLVFILLILGMILLILLSNFFGAAEICYSSINRIRLEKMVEEGVKNARKALYIVDKYDYTLITILVVNTLINTIITLIGGYIVLLLITNPTIATLITTAVVTILLLIFGEILPKSLAKKNPEKASLKNAPLMFIIMKIFYPITILFYKFNKVLTKNIKNEQYPTVTSDEVEDIIDKMEEEGVLDQDDAQIISGAISIQHKKVADIMTPRVDMVAIEINSDIEKIKQIFTTEQYSRVPIYKEDKDKIVGVLSQKDFFTALVLNKKIDISKMMSKPFFISGSTDVSDFIKEAQRMHKHFAVVVDEYGGTDGIITLEDALEEIVGEIYDETDEEEIPILEKINDNHYVVLASMEIDELFEQLKLGKDPDSKYSNVGGLIYDLCEGIPEVGKSVTISSKYENLDFDNPISNNYELTFVLKVVKHRRIISLDLYIKLSTEEED